MGASDSHRHKYTVALVIYSLLAVAALFSDAEPNLINNGGDSANLSNNIFAIMNDSIPLISATDPYSFSAAGGPSLNYAAPADKIQLADLSAGIHDNQNLLAKSCSSDEYSADSASQLQKLDDGVALMDAQQMSNQNYADNLFTDIAPNQEAPSKDMVAKGNHGALGGSSSSGDSNNFGDFQRVVKNPYMLGDSSCSDSSSWKTVKESSGSCSSSHRNSTCSSESSRHHHHPHHSHHSHHGHHQDCRRNLSSNSTCRKSSFEERSRSDTNDSEAFSPGICESATFSQTRNRRHHHTQCQESNDSATLVGTSGTTWILLTEIVETSGTTWITLDERAKTTGTTWVTLCAEPKTSSTTWLHLGNGLKTSGTTWLTLNEPIETSGTTWISMAEPTETSGTTWVTIFSHRPHHHGNRSRDHCYWGRSSVQNSVPTRFEESAKETDCSSYLDQEPSEDLSVIAPVKPINHIVRTTENLFSMATAGDWSSIDTDYPSSDYLSSGWLESSMDESSSNEEYGHGFKDPNHPSCSDSAPTSTAARIQSRPTTVVETYYKDGKYQTISVSATIRTKDVFITVPTAIKQRAAKLFKHKCYNALFFHLRAVLDMCDCTRVDVLPQPDYREGAVIQIVGYKPESAGAGKISCFPEIERRVIVICNMFDHIRAEFFRSANDVLMIRLRRVKDKHKYRLYCPVKKGALSVQCSDLNLLYNKKNCPDAKRQFNSRNEYC